MPIFNIVLIFRQMTNSSGIIFPILFFLILASFLFYKERYVFFKKNSALLNWLHSLSKSQRFENIWCSFSTVKIIASGSFMKIWLIPNGIILVDDYSLNLNKIARKTANTYLLFWPQESNLSIDKNLFRNLGIIQELKIDNNGKITIKAEISQQSPFKSIGFSSSRYDLNIEFSLSLPFDKTTDLFKQYKMQK